MKRVLPTLILATVTLTSTSQQVERNYNAQTGKTDWSTNPFERKVFIENKGQFDNNNGIKNSGFDKLTDHKIVYGIFDRGTQYYFTSSGWTYRNELEVSDDDEDANVEAAAGSTSSPTTDANADQEEQLHK